MPKYEHGSSDRGKYKINAHAKTKGTTSSGRTKLSSGLTKRSAKGTMR